MDSTAKLFYLGNSECPSTFAGGITVITLTRNNPAMLEETLSALPAAAAGLAWPWQVLVLDGSDDEACAMVAQAHAMDLPLRYEHRPARGIYAAMNDAMALAEGSLISFMNAGDRYLPGGLTALVAHWHTLLQPGRSLPAAVFGQAWVQPCSNSAVGWITPDPAMRRLQRWLRVMVPCHQAFAFELGFARDNPYSTETLLADRVVMRAALALTGPAAYLRQQVCIYDLSGVSSCLPRSNELWLRLREPQLSGPERAAELVKALLQPLLAGGYPLLMRWRAWLWARCCR